MAVVGVVVGAATPVSRALGEVRPVPARGALVAFERPEPPAPHTASWIRFGSQKSRLPKLQRAEAGITLSLGKRVAVQLQYARTTLAPMMHRDHDDGILTRVRFGF